MAQYIGRTCDYVPDAEGGEAQPSCGKHVTGKKLILAINDKAVELDLCEEHSKELEGEYSWWEQLGRRASVAAAFDVLNAAAREKPTDYTIEVYGPPTKRRRRYRLKDGQIATSVEIKKWLDDNGYNPSKMGKLTSAQVDTYMRNRARTRTRT